MLLNQQKTYLKAIVLFSAFMLMILCSNSFAKTTISSWTYNSDLRGTVEGGPQINVDKCVLTVAPYVLENDVNSYIMVSQCADFDDMQAYARGQIQNFHVYTFFVSSTLTRAQMRSWTPPSNLTRGNVWTVSFIFANDYLAKVERQIYYISNRVKTYTSVKTPRQAEPETAKRFQHLTTVDKLISGDW